MNKPRKRGQSVTLQGMSGIVVVVLTIALVLGFGAKITDKVTDNFLTTEAVVNETQTSWTTSAPVQVANEHKEKFSLDTTAANILVTNESNGYLHPASNYTFDANGTIFWLESTEDVSDKNITYTYTAVTTTAGAVAVNGSVSVGELASWLPTIAIILAAAIIIGIVVTYFAFNRT